MKLFVIPAVLGALVLGGCEEQQVQYLEKYKVVIAPGSMYNCPQIKKWPDIKTLTDLQVAETIMKLAENNRICKASMDKIRKFYDDAKRRIEGNQATQRRADRR